MDLQTTVKGKKKGLLKQTNKQQKQLINEFS